jgi:16S rRNA (guanine966-N2)-methyltransferase
MRIIAGEFRGRRLHAPEPGSPARPMPDRVRESLFSILRGHFEGQSVLDAFAGTGTVGLEALSRGAARCVFVERDRASAEGLRRNIEALEVSERCEVVVGDSLGAGALARCPDPVHIVFMDPPYALTREIAGLARVAAQAAKLGERLDETGFLVLRTPWPMRGPPIADLDGPETHAYGSMALHLYGRPSPRSGHSPP